MKHIPIIGTVNTPGVVYDPEAGSICIEGRSIPENPGEYYSRLAEWTFGVLCKPYPKIVMEFRLDYINSSSAKQIMNYLKGVRDRIYDGCDCHIIWYYEDDDESIMELGEHIKTTLDIPFELKKL
jgi:hypothetical protein